MSTDTEAYMDDETGAILAAKLKGDMRKLIRDELASALQDPAFWTQVPTSYPLQDAVLRNGMGGHPNFAQAVRQVIVSQMQR